MVWKRWFSWAFASNFSLVMPFSHESERKTEPMKLIFTDYQLTICSFIPAITLYEVINKSQGDLNSSNSNYFPLCLPLSISIALLLSIFCVLVWPRQSLHTFCALAGWCKSSNHFSMPPPRVLVCESGHSDRSESFVFETLVSTRTLHS